MFLLFLHEVKVKASIECCSSLSRFHTIVAVLVPAPCWSGFSSSLYAAYALSLLYVHTVCLGPGRLVNLSSKIIVELYEDVLPLECSIHTYTWIKMIRINNEIEITLLLHGYPFQAKLQSNRTNASLKLQKRKPSYS